MATNADDLRAALRLRYEVFNLELGEGLSASHSTGHDFDEFDAVADHIVVKLETTGEVVGTYRLQTGKTASRNLGYYSEREFEFAPYEPIRSQVLELGRACIDQRHRSTQVLTLLWKGIAQYALKQNCRYLIGCSSVNSTDRTIGILVYDQLKLFLAPEELRTSPVPHCRLDVDTLAIPSVEAKVPRLLRAYLAVGAFICGAPALDSEFGTIDFLTLLDLGRLPKGVRGRFLGNG